jgi:RNA polymerase sigma-70 factor (ECF subfamily)
LFARYWRLVFAISWKIVRERAAAEDVVQEVFLTIYIKRDLYDSTRGSIKTWIAQFAHFKSMIKRRHQQTQELECLDDITRFESEIKGLSAYHEVFEQATLVEECLLSLNTRQRRTVELIHFEGYTLLETAGILKESLANTRNLYYRGMKALRSYLTNASVQSTKKFASRGRGLPVASRDSIILGAD